MKKLLTNTLICLGILVSIPLSGQVAEEWVARYNGPGNSTDQAWAMAVDNAGNVLVTGNSWNGNNYDYAMVKYDATGAQLWVATYNGPGNSDDNARALAVDGAGNVYVTGYSIGSGSSHDYATVKYDAAGTQQWVARYNGPVNSNDQARAMAVDGTGNIYVTGFSWNGSSHDYATVKYDAAGAQQWVATYNGPANSTDQAWAMAVDNAGNTYVTGYSVNGSINFDYATVKYDAAGAQQWVARYNGPANSNDVAFAIAADGAGNVFVTGHSWNTSNADYATVKYDAAGAQQWVATYNGPGNNYDEARAIAVDGAGNVFVTGYSWNGSHDDYATVKYNAAGAQQWVARYNGTGNNSDGAFAMAVDNAGNIYVTGYSWNGSSHDYATVKYDATGVQQWVTTYNGPGNSSDFALAMAIDGAGNVYVTGYSVGSGSNTDYATVKYSQVTGEWVGRYNGPANGIDIALAMATDGAGNVLVTGYSWNFTHNGYDFATVKYDVVGAQQWVTTYNGPGNRDDFARAMAVDNAGNVYVTGSSYNTSNTDYATVKYDAAGTQQWVARYNGPGNFEDFASAIAVDGAGNVYVTGYSWNFTHNGYDFATVKYNATGAQQWVATYNGPANGTDQVFAMAVDAAGNIYVTGSSWNGSSHDHDYATVKYDATGTQQWVAHYNAPASGEDVAQAITVDNAGNVLVTGYSYNGSSSHDYATVKYDATGTQQWVARYNSPAFSSDVAQAMAVDGTGNVYVTGRSFNGSNDDYATVKYDATGTQQWVATYNGPGNRDDIAYAMALDGAGNVFVTGSSAVGTKKSTNYLLTFLKENR